MPVELKVIHLAPGETAQLPDGTACLVLYEPHTLWVVRLDAQTWLWRHSSGLECLSLKGPDS